MGHDRGRARDGLIFPDKRSPYNVRMCKSRACVSIICIHVTSETSTHHLNVAKYKNYYSERKIKLINRNSVHIVLYSKPRLECEFNNIVDRDNVNYFTNLEHLMVRWQNRIPPMTSQAICQVHISIIIVACFSTRNYKRTSDCHLTRLLLNVKNQFVAFFN